LEAAAYEASKAGGAARFGENRFAPYPLAPEWRSAWQSLSLGDGGPALGGQLRVPAPWQDPSLWAE